MPQKLVLASKKEPPLMEALGEISFAVMFLHEESFGSSTSLMPYK